MRWEEAVQVALCYGWIDSTVKKMDHERRKQVFSPRKDKSVWSKLNKTYIEKLLKENGITEKVIFYGIEDIETSNIAWKLFSTIKRQTPNFVQFNKLPAAKLQGVVTRVEM